MLGTGCQKLATSNLQPAACLAFYPAPGMHMQLGPLCARFAGAPEFSVAVRLRFCSTVSTAKKTPEMGALKPAATPAIQAAGQAH